MTDISRKEPPGKTRHFVGFDGLRLAAALSVIFSHAFLLATGTEDGEPMVRLLGPGNILGLYGVFTFFIISGFLLTRSLAANGDPLTYAVNRLLRIGPGFIVCVLLTAFLIGPIASPAPWPAYLQDPGLLGYVRWSISTLRDWGLPTVFSYDGEIANIVNGSLWSLHYEALSYIFLLAAWLSMRSLPRLTAGLVVLALLVWTVPAVEQRLVSIEYTLPYFSAGVAMAWFHGRYGTHLRGALLAALGLVVAAPFGWQAYAFAPFGAYLVVFFGERPNPGSRLASVIGDCSYGLYLYGWPAEQLVKQFTGTTSPMALILAATPLTFVFALASYHFVERPAMNAKRTVAGGVAAAWAWMAGGHSGAAALGARVAFIVVATMILTAQALWWFFLYSLGLVILSAWLGGLLGVVMSATASAWNRGDRHRGVPERGGPARLVGRDRSRRPEIPL